MPQMQKAQPQDLEIVEELINLNHPDLLESHARVGLIMCWPSTNKNGEVEGHAVSKNGYKLVADVSINKYRDRVRGLNDADVYVDATVWEHAGEWERKGIVDQQLQRLAVKRDKNDAIVTDDLERPKLRMRHYDFNYQGFDVCARRFGPESQEVLGFQEIQRRRSQLWLPGMGEDEPPKGKRKKKEEQPEEEPVPAGA